MIEYKIINTNAYDAGKKLNKYFKKNWKLKCGHIFIDRQFKRKGCWFDSVQYLLWRSRNEIH